MTLTLIRPLTLIEHAALIHRLGERRGAGERSHSVVGVVIQ